MKGHLLMSLKERTRKSCFDRVQDGQMTLKDASFVLRLSYRQCRRSYKRYREQGDEGLVHRSRGRPSKRGKPKLLKDKVLARYEQRYKGFGPTLAAEKLAQEGLVMDHETLRRWLIADNKPFKRRKRSGHRSWRERKGHFGELVQLDGSPHKWFGPDGPECFLMNMVDDATGYTMSLLSDEETTEAAMTLQWHWVERFGIPQALYVDKKNVYVTGRDPTLEEQFAEVKPATAFGKCSGKLGTDINIAHSPQAKGRVERSHGVYQDRFVKELALRGITTIETANKLLACGFCDELNDKFAKPPASDVDYHRPVPKGLDLADVFCFEATRVVQNDWTVRHQNRHYQIHENNRPLPRPKARVTVRTRLDGTVALLFKDKSLRFHEIKPNARHTTQTRQRAKPSQANKPKSSKKTSRPLPKKMAS